MNNPIKPIISFFTEPFKYYLDVLKSGDCLRIENLNQNSVLINDYIENLYCIELAGAGENIEFLPNSLIDMLYKDFENIETGEMSWVLIKNGIYQKNLIFTQNEKIAKAITANVKSKLLDFDEISNVLLSLFFNNEYEIDYYKKQLKQKYSLMLEDDYKNPLITYNTMIRERVLKNYKDVKFYQAISYDNGYSQEDYKDVKFDINSFFSMNFTGALFTKIIFNRNSMLNDLQKQKDKTIGIGNAQYKRKIEALEDLVKNDQMGMINTTLMIIEDNDNNISTLAERYIGCKFDIVQRDKRNLNNNTPIFYTNKTFSRVIERSFLYNYICFNSKLDSDKPDLVGLNINNAFVNFGFKKATAINSIPKAHTILLGTSGAGKTQAANDIFKQLVGFDYRSGETINIKKTNHIIFDIKDSVYNQVNLIHKFQPNLVDMNDFDKNDFMYNIIECDITEKGSRKLVDEGDLTFLTVLVSLILSSMDETNKLTSSESEELKSVVRELYINDNFEKMTIGYIETTHNKEYQELLNLGYSDFTSFDEVKEKEFDKFKKPLLHNALNILKQRESDYLISNKELKASLVQSLIFKLETIEQVGIFSSFSKLNFQDKPIIYFKTDSLLEGSSEEYGYMVFAMLSIIVKMVKKKQHSKRMKGQNRPMVYFWFEEARNIFSNKLFREKEIFERVINEWRSYDMVFFPITQEPQHIPDTILNGFEIKMLLISGNDEEEKEELLNSLSTRLAIGQKRRKILESLPKYTMMIMYGDGAFTMKFKDDPDFRAIVNT